MAEQAAFADAFVDVEELVAANVELCMIWEAERQVYSVPVMMAIGKVIRETKRVVGNHPVLLNGGSGGATEGSDQG